MHYRAKDLLLMGEVVKDFLDRNEGNILLAARSEVASSLPTAASFLGYATGAEANLLANTRLRAPIKVGSGPRVESRIGVEGNPRQMLESTDALRSSTMIGHTRTIGPPTMTASGARP